MAKVTVPTSITVGHTAVAAIEIESQPTVSTTPKKSWWKRLLCSHSWKFLYREDLMFYQECMGHVKHFECSECGSTKTETHE